MLRRERLPATLATLSASWLLAPLRLGLRGFPPPDVERMLRRCTSVALKKATMKGCLFWGPLRPIRPATRGLMLSPAGGDREGQSVGRCPAQKSHASRARGKLWGQIDVRSLGAACVYSTRLWPPPFCSPHLFLTWSIKLLLSFTRPPYSQLSKPPQEMCATAHQSPATRGFGRRAWAAGASAFMCAPAVFIKFSHRGKGVWSSSGGVNQGFLWLPPAGKRPMRLSVHAHL